MSFLLVLAFLFYTGSMFGWCLELIWRRFFSKNNPERKWINPGFLTGPYLPLYGISLITLFCLSYINVSFIENTVLQKIVLFVLMAFCITVVEYIAGLIFIKGMNIKLWDYSNCLGNIKGIVCPQYSFYWTILSAIYYFIIHPKVLNSLFWLSQHITFSFFIGMFYGIFIIDLSYSLNILSKIRSFAKENKVIVKFEHLKNHIQKKNAEHMESHFIFAIKSNHANLKENLKHYLEKM